MLQDIDRHLCRVHAVLMTTKMIRLRPDDCCSVPLVEPSLADDDRDRLLLALKALADGTRLRIFELIAAQDAPVCACDIVDRFDVSQPTIAHHLRTLREAGLITTTRQGVWAFYAVDPAGLARVGSLFFRATRVSPFLVAR